ncbi:site-specific DNA-methyltransferase [Brachybacterium avium]|uniref:Site-specific DNA-methyltransferase n=1 Tax=Brachybacterium avium TaxID=2017485 RepID=A0A220UE44_9MICO|nr:site-specific DNA-methyltransferase [Brachybacterium avium]ASK66186.1 site-specific DNA-methyltransferase [Brachybacterium avium]
MREEIHETLSTTPNFQTELAAQLAELMPEVIADGKVDVEKLTELLDGDAAETSERFGLFWPGKKRALRAAQEPTTATLRPDFEKSKDWDTTKNVFIEGDNLEVLKILQKHYHAKIKMIYIDPPYNTGKDFVYPDNYKEGLDTYLEWTRQVNEEGKKLSTNADTEGRYHSNWLNMMYPRLKLARNLLTEDGVIFVSIDDHEQGQLRRLMDEIFGESNFVAQIVWEKVHTRKNSARQFSVSHDYVLCYARKKMQEPGDGGFQRSLLPRDNTSAYKNPDGDPQGPWKADPIYANNPYDADYVITKPDGTEISRPSGQYWRYSKATIDEAIRTRALIWGSGSSMPMIKRYLADVQDGMVPVTLFSRVFAGDNSSAKSEVKDLFGGKPLFSYPKPTRLIQRLIQIAGVGAGDYVLDFFAGSGSTAHATMALSASDGIFRRSISVQLPEPTLSDSEAASEGYGDIAALSRERISRAGVAIAKNFPGTGVDLGFRAYVLIDTNFAKWKVSSDVDRNQLEQHLFDLRESSSEDGVSADDLLSEILLKQGYSLAEQIAPVDVAGLNLRSVGDGIVLAYLNEHVKPTLEQLRAVTDEDPQRLIVLEDAFQGDDQLKTNLAQLCKSRGIEHWTA